MRKSNWIILAVALLASAFLLWLWYFLKFDRIDSPLDLVLSIVWWVLIALAALGISRAERRRRERVRTSYVAPGAVFNPEAGVVGVAPGADAVAAIEGILANLEYGFDRQEPPSRDEMAFDYVVRTKVFEPAEGGAADADAAAASVDAAAGSAASAAAGASEAASNEPKWEGEVACANRPDEDPRPFSSRAELAALLG